MELTSLPTDSIHKFMSISGLLLIISSFIYIDNQKEEYNKSLVNYQYDLEIIIIKKRYLHEQQDNYIAAITKFSKELNRLNKSSGDELTKLTNASGKKRVEQINDYIRAARAGTEYAKSNKPYGDEQDKILSELLMQSNIEDKQIDRKQELIRLIENRIKLAESLELPVYFFGILLFICGFVRWYQIQKHTDNILIKESRR